MLIVVDDDHEDFKIISEGIKAINPSAKLMHFNDAQECLEQFPSMIPKPCVIISISI